MGKTADIDFIQYMVTVVTEELKAEGKDVTLPGEPREMVTVLGDLKHDVAKEYTESMILLLMKTIGKQDLAA